MKSDYTAKHVQNLYMLIAKKLKIEPITEGRMMRESIQEILAGKDIMKLKDASVRNAKKRAIRKIAEVYGKRSKRFWNTFISYNYYMGKIKAFDDLLEIKKSRYLESGKKYYAKQLLNLFK
jgi:hypothetical protein